MPKWSVKTILNTEFSKEAIRKTIAFLGAAFIIGSANSNPVLNNVASGNVVVRQSPGVTQVNQGSQKAIINWKSFNIDPNEQTHFNQPQGGIALNRIDASQGASQIFGVLTATGKIILVNQAGIFFGPNSRVDVGGIMASTSDISNKNFLAGKYIFDQPSATDGRIVNQGQIIAARHGLVALIGNQVDNQGYIQANLGNVVLASGRKFTVDFSGNKLINFTIDEASTSATADSSGKKHGVKNSGTVIADGGRIVMSARAAEGVLDNVINMEGVAQARSVRQQGGKIILAGNDSSGVVRVAGKVDVSSRVAKVKGGSVKVTGKKILVDQGAKIDASGDAGGGEILIGGDYQGKTPIKIFDDKQTLANASETVMMPGSEINADATNNGKGGKIILWGDDSTTAQGNIFARGGANGGDGGFVETSGHYLNANGLSVDLSAAKGQTGTWLLDPTNIYIAASQANATAAGMSGTNVAGSSGGNPNTFSASGAVQDSLVLIGNSGTAGTLVNALQTANVVVSTTNASGTGVGNMTVVDPISWSTTNSLTLTAANILNLNAGITATNGSLTLTAANILNLNAGITATNGKLTLTSGTINPNSSINVKDFTLSSGSVWSQFTISGAQTFNVTNDFVISSGAFFQRFAGGDGGASPYQIQDIYGLQGAAMGLTLSNNYKLTANIDASVTANWTSIDSSTGTGFVPIGSYSGATPYTGTFHGNSKTISNLTINRPSKQGIGLFGYLGAGASTNGTINGGTADSGGSETLTITGNITGNALVGGLVGSADGASGKTISISNVAFIGNVTGDPSNGQFIGGLVGDTGSTGAITNISNSFVSGTVTGKSKTGGFIGAHLSNGGTITNSYSQSAVIVNTTGGIEVGGFVGEDINGSINNSYAIGYINPNGVSSVGGFAGGGSGGTFSNNYWNTTTSGQASNLGSTATAKTTSQLQTSVASLGFSGTTWGMVSGSYPYLKVFYPDTALPRVISGTSFSAGGGKTVNIAVGGASADSGVRTGNDNSFYSLTSNTAIAQNAPVLVYPSSSTSVGNIVFIAPAPTTSVTGLTFTANTLTLGNGTSATISNTNLGTAKGSLSATDILYSVSSGNLTVGNATNLTTNLTSTANTTYSVDGTVARVASGSGNYTFNGPVTFGGSGNSITSNGTQTYNNPVTLNTTTTFDAGSNGITFGGAIGGASGLVKAGSGTMTMSVGNTYTGSTTINAGTLLINNSNALNNSSAVIFGATVGSGANLTLGVSSATINTLSGGASSGASVSGDLVVGSGQTLTINQVSAGTFSGRASGAGEVDISGNGGILTWNPDYTGATGIFTGTLNIAQGTVWLGAATDTLPTTAILNVTTGATLDFRGTGDTAGPITGGGTITNGSIGSDFSSSFGTGTFTFSGAITGASDFTKWNTGNLILSGSNSSYTNGTTINGGTLSISTLNDSGNNSSIGTGNITIGNSGNGVLAYTNTGIDAVTNRSLTLSTAGSVDVTSGTSLVWTGSINGSAGLTKSNSGTLMLSANNSATYTGAITVSGGTLAASVDNALGSAGVGTTVSSGATLDILTSYAATEGVTLNGGTIGSSSGTNSFAGAITLGTGGGIVSANTQLTLSGAIGGSTALTKSGAGTVVLSNASNSYSGGTTISNGVLSIGTLAASGSNSSIGTSNLTLSGGTLAYTGTNISTNRTLTLSTSGGTVNVSSNGILTWAGSLSGSTALTKTNSGTLTLSADNSASYTGAITVSGGTLAVTGNNALGNTGAGTTISSGASLDFQNVNYAAAESLTVNGGNILTSTGSSTFAGGISLGTGGATINVGGTQLTLSGAISGSTALTKSGTGIALLSTNNSSFTGATSINQGTLAVSANNALGTVAGGTTVASGAILDFQNVAYSTAEGVTLNGGTISSSVGATNSFAGAITLGASGGIFDVASSPFTLSGAIGSTGALTKSGNAGTLILSNASNSYSGGTTISNGVLSIGTLAASGSNSSIGTSNLTLSGGTLAYTGTNISTNRTLTLSTSGGTTV